jgi:tetratricopeptide (TPR) repeat protein
LQQYHAARARGDTLAAVRAASDACHAVPSCPQCHYAYGEAWLAAGDPARAAQAFGAAIRLAPYWADAWINLGIARYRQGDVEDARTAMRQALLHVPGHPTASANLGALLRISGGAEEAEALLQASLTRDPDNVAARLNLAADLLQEERAAEALALLDAVPPPAEPRASCHWLLQRALALLQLRRVNEARAVLEAIAAAGPIPSEIAPLWHWRQVLLARQVGDVDAAVAAARAMDAALRNMGPAAVPEHQIMGHYDLAKFWSGLGQHAVAFEHWREGHALLRPMQPFSRAAHASFIDSSIALFNQDRLNRGPRASNTDAAPVFIVGMPRSGTTLCEQILAAHAQAHGAGERPALAQMFAALAGGPDSAEAVRRVAALDAQTLDTAAERYLAELHALAPDKCRIVDKLPGNYLYVGFAALLLPAARFIHCVRDPRDIGLSIFTFRFHGAHGYAHDLGDLGWTIGQQTRLMEHWKTVLPGRILTVALSDWVNEFSVTLARVLEHVGLPHDPACERFYEREDRVRTVSRAQVRQPVNARGLGRWRDFAVQLAPLIAELERADSLK